MFNQSLAIFIYPFSLACHSNSFFVAHLRNKVLLFTQVSLFFFLSILATRPFSKAFVWYPTHTVWIAYASMLTTITAFLECFASFIYYALTARTLVAMGMGYICIYIYISVCVCMSIAFCYQLLARSRLHRAIQIHCWFSLGMAEGKNKIRRANRDWELRAWREFLSLLQFPLTALCMIRLLFATRLCLFLLVVPRFSS